MSEHNNSLLLFSLPEDQHCKGHENFTSWEIYMLAHGAPCGLVNYWENKITIPPDPNSTPQTSQSPTASSTTTATDADLTTPTTATLTTTLTPLHSLTPTFLEYQLHESIALSLILINLVDIPGTGINPKGKSHEAWALLKEQYGKPGERTRNMRECNLDECNINGMKVAGEGGHIERMRTLRKLANSVGMNYNDLRFKTKLIDSFPKLWDVICLICYSMASISEVISTLTSHGKQVLHTKTPTAIHSNYTVKALEVSILAL